MRCLFQIGMTTVWDLQPPIRVSFLGGMATKANLSSSKNALSEYISTKLKVLFVKRESCLPGMYVQRLFFCNQFKLDTPYVQMSAHWQLCYKSSSNKCTQILSNLVYNKRQNQFEMMRLRPGMWNPSNPIVRQEHFFFFLIQMYKGYRAVFSAFSYTQPHQ